MLNLENRHPTRSPARVNPGLEPRVLRQALARRLPPETPVLESLRAITSSLAAGSRRSANPSFIWEFSLLDLRVVVFANRSVTNGVSPVNQPLLQIGVHALQ